MTIIGNKYLSHLTIRPKSRKKLFRSQMDRFLMRARRIELRSAADLKMEGGNHKPLDHTRDELSMLFDVQDRFYLHI